MSGIKARGGGANSRLVAAVYPSLCWASAMLVPYTAIAIFIEAANGRTLALMTAYYRNEDGIHRDISDGLA